MLDDPLRHRTGGAALIGRFSTASGIIAAGAGSRLAQSHPGTVKPLVPVSGRPLAHWVVDGLREAGCREVSVLTNSRGGAVAPSLISSFPDLEFDCVCADTASSFESFRLMSQRLAARADAFLISTVDALIAPAELGRFLGECRAARVVAGLALTRFVSDEKPLWVDETEGLITAVGEDAREHRAVTCGLYYMTRTAAERLPAAAAHARLRDFWTALVRSSARVSGVVLSDTIDVDRPEDLAAAEIFLEKAR